MKSMTVEQVFAALESAIEQMTPRDKALLRIQIRKDYRLPAIEEPDA